MPKKNFPKPITMKEIVAGKKYIVVGVDIQGGMFIEYPVFREQPVRKRDGWWVRVGVNKEGFSSSIDFLTNFQSVSDLGMDPGTHTEHRTFRYTNQNRRVLATLVRHPSLRQSLREIGLQYDPDSYDRAGTMNF